MGLVDDRRRDLTQLVAVLSGVVGAEQELATGLELDAQVGLGATTVTTVGRAQGGGTRGNRSIHVDLVSLLGVLLNVAAGAKIPGWLHVT